MSGQTDRQSSHEELLTGARSELGTALYQSLPAVYRTRDENHHLREYLDACGGLLDDLRKLIDQRLTDSFPSSKGFQPWLLPYVADLLGVPLAALDDEALTAEVQNAIRWRQRKGTLPTAREIVEVLGQFRRDGQRKESLGQLIEINEGWKRVARTPRVGDRYRAERSEQVEPTQETPSPMPAARTPRVRRPLSNPESATLAQNGPYQDRRPRTPDLRPIDLIKGHAHPRSVLVFVPNFCGFFFPGWRASSANETLAGSSTEQAPLEKANCIIDGTLIIDADYVTIRCCAIKMLEIGRVPLCLRIEDSLIDTITVSGQLTPGNMLHRWGIALVGVTVLTTLSLDALQNTQTQDKHVFASDCLLPTAMNPVNLATRFCAQQPKTDADAAWPFISRSWGEPGCGVLAPDAPESLRSGSEDGGELGAYHHRRYVLRERAIVSKLEEYLPLGSRVVVIPTSELSQWPKRPQTPPQGGRVNLEILPIDKDTPPLDLVKENVAVRLSGRDSSSPAGSPLASYEFTILPGWFEELITPKPVPPLNPTEPPLPSRGSHAELAVLDLTGTQSLGTLKENQGLRLSGQGSADETGTITDYDFILLPGLLGEEP